MKVSNMTSNNGRAVPNQFIIEAEDREVFQSYNSVIAIRYYSGRIVLDAEKWDYSKTTSTYRNQFLGEDTKQTRAKIDSGEYELANLN